MFGQNGKLGHSCVRVTKSRFSESCIKDHIVHLGINVSSYGCVVGGINAMAVI